MLCRSYEGAIETLDSSSENIGRIWNIGGAQIYKLGLEHGSCHRLYITKIYNDVACDAHFPSFKKENFKDVTAEVAEAEGIPRGVQEEKGFEYEFFVLQKN